MSECRRNTRQRPAILQTGRLYELGAAFINVAPNMVHNEIRNPATEVVAFTTMRESAGGFLEAEWGFRDEDLRRLPQFHYTARRKAGGEVRGVVTS